MSIEKADVSPTLRSESHQHEPIVCMAFDNYNMAVTEKQASLGTNCGMSTGRNQVICMATQQGAEVRTDNMSPCLTASAGMSGNNQPVICFDPKWLSESEVSTSIMGENAKDNPCVCYCQTSFAQYEEGVGTLRANGGDIGGGQ